MRKQCLCTIWMVALSWMMAGLTACSTIDDDLSNCPPEVDSNSYELNYELRLVTNLTTELQTILSTQTDIALASALQTHLSGVFTDYAHDVDLSFYDTQGDSVRLQHDEHIMDANQASYALNLPKRQYMHLACANVVDNPVVGLHAGESCHQSQLQQVAGDTIASHTTGVFTARQQMEVLEGIDQTFNVHLYMANCAAAIVVDTLGSGVKNLQVFTTGFASAFNIADSTYVFDTVSPVIRTTKVTSPDSRAQMFCAVSFPSPEKPLTRTIIETTDPFIAPSADSALWQFVVYATTADGSVTKSNLYVNTPLRAGQLKIVKAKANADGSMTSASQEVAVLVTLHWQPGGSYNPEI